MNGIEIFTYLGLGYVAIAAIDRFYHDRVSWKDTAYMVFLLFVSANVFYFSKDIAVTIAHNAVSSFVLTSQSSYMRDLMYCLIILAGTGIAWHALLKYIVKPSSTSGKFVLAFGSAIIGLSYISDTLTKYATSLGIDNTGQFLYVCIAIIMITAIIALIHWRKEIQEFIAVPVGFVMLYGIYAYSYYHYSGINVLNNMRNSGHSSGGVLITIAVAVLFGTVWYRSKPWYERRSYKVLATFASLFMAYGLFSTFAYISGALDKHEWQATQDENIAVQVADERKAIKLTGTTINGYTRDEAMAVINDPNSSDQEIDQALISVKERRKLQATRVTEKESPEGTVNEEKVGNFFSTVFSFPGKLWAMLPWTGDDGTTPKATKKSVANINISQSGTYNIPAKKGCTSGWIIIETGGNGKYNFKSDKWKFIVTYHDGEVAKAWEIKKWPTKKLIKFKVTNLSDEQLKLIVS